MTGGTVVVAAVVVDDAETVAAAAAVVFPDYDNVPYTDHYSTYQSHSRMHRTHC